VTANTTTRRRSEQVRFIFLAAASTTNMRTDGEHAQTRGQIVFLRGRDCLVGRILSWHATCKLGNYTRLPLSGCATVDTVPDCAPLHHHHCDDHTPLSYGTTSVVAVLLDSPAQCFHLPSLGHHADSCSQVDQQSALVPMSSHLPLTHHARTHGRTHARQLLRP
jgi:hypothetical protein